MFPTKTNMCPKDEDCYFDSPDLLTPIYDEVHISVTFSWDIIKAYKLKEQWQDKAMSIKIDGVAISGESDQPFIAGRYLKSGITITSRGCPNRCWFCEVRQGLIEFDNFPKGNIVQDNNILACSRKHWDSVIQMLKKQKQIQFKGGLEANRLTDKHIEDLRSLRISELWFACDSPNAISSIRKISDKVKCFGKNKLRCYVLIGRDRDEEEYRLREVFNMGFLPFAQLYQPRERINYLREWQQFARRWSRPAIYKNIMYGI